MKEKTSNFNMFSYMAMSLVLGLLLLSGNPEVAQKSLEVSHVESILEEASFELTGNRRAEFVSYLLATAKDYEFDPLLILAIMKVESAFDPDAISSAGAFGLLQIKPIAAREVSNVFETGALLEYHLMDPFVNVRIGIQYLAFLREAIGANPAKMLAAYNLGPTHVKRYGYNMRYAGKVLNAYHSFLKQADMV